MEEELIQKANENLKSIVDFAFVNNRIVMSKTEDGKEIINHIPLSILPYKVDGKKLKQLVSEQEIWQELLFKIAMDDQLIENYFSKLQHNDSFIKSLYQIHQKVLQNNQWKRHNEFCIIRNDFMMNDQTGQWLQVEYNLIACVYPHFGPMMVQFHQTIFDNYFKEIFEKQHGEQNFTVFGQPDYDTRVEILAKAFYQYNDKQSYILFIVGEFESNLFDQRAMEFQLLQLNIKSIRMTFQQISQSHSYLDQNGKYYIQDKQIAILYFRSGFQENQYSDLFWKIRENMEISIAIKIPSARFQLVNFKILQLYLEKDHLIDKYLNQQQADIIRKRLAKILEISDQESLQQLKKLVKENIDDYVLKPQKEGGGNNFYGEEILQQFEQQPLQELQSHILMQKIKSNSQFGMFIKNRQLMIGQVISEVGLISYIECDKHQIFDKKVGGYLERTKLSHINEGGVVTGFAAFDSLLIDNI